MARVKRAALSRVRKNRLYARVKGFFLGRQRLRQAMEHSDRAKRFAFRGRKEKKRHFRGLWIVRINAALAGSRSAAARRRSVSTARSGSSASTRRSRPPTSPTAASSMA